MDIKERFNKMINIKNISDFIFLISFYNLYFISFSLFFNNFNYIYLIGNIAIILLFFSKNLLSKKIDLILNFVLLGLISILFIIYFNQYILGYKILMNNVFNISQSLTSYKYNFYSINALLSSQKSALFIICLINSLLFSLVIFNLFRFFKGFLILLINIPLILLSIYFEIPFNNVCIILMILLNISFISLNIYLNSNGYKNNLKRMKMKNISILLSFSLLFGGSISLISSQYSSLSSVSNISSNIRDYFNNPINEKDNSQNKNDSNSNVENNDNNDSSNDSKDEAGKIISKVPILLIILIFIFAIILLIPIFLIIKEIIKRKNNKKLLNSSDIKILIKSNYLESIKILRKLGIKYQNKGYLEYVNDLKDFDEIYKNLYLESSKIYLKSAYSENNIDNEEIKIIKEFYKETLSLLITKSKGIKKVYWRVIRKYE